MTFFLTQRNESLRSQFAAGAALWFTLLLCVWIYWPGLSGPTLLDDGANLYVVESLDEASGYLGDIVSGNTSGPLGRPVSMLSFALDRLFRDGTVWSFKATNLALHLLNGCFVAWLAVRMSPWLAGRRVAAGWGVLAAAFWMLTPLSVSTTLYIVQRMTQLSTLFCLLGLLVYVQGRERLESGDRRGWWQIALLLPCALLAVMSKENGAVLVGLIMLTEAAAWRLRVRSDPRQTMVLQAIHGSVFATGVITVIAYFLISPGSIFDGYEKRDFSLTERLMTEARVLWDYIWCLLVPSRHGLGVYHDDYVVSRGLMDPAGTLPAILGILGAMSFAFAKLWRGRSVVGWAILFFLIGHAIESSVIPLEIYFEHRNYLPAVGVYLALALGIERFMKRFAWTGPVLGVSVALWLATAAVQTGLLSVVWSKEVLLHLDAERWHPNSLRVLSNLGVIFARMGDLDQANRYIERAEALDEPGHLRHSIRKLTLHCVANANADLQLVRETGSRLNVASLSDAMVSESLQILVERVNRGGCPVFDARPLAAEFGAHLLGPAAVRAPPRVYALLAMLELYLGETLRARDYLDLWLEREPESAPGWMMMLSAYPPGSDDLKREQALNTLKELWSRGMLTREQGDDVELLAPGWKRFEHISP